ncbi:MAG: sigma-70 family RNA polymerase sigma factor [Archangium sp.]
MTPAPDSLDDALTHAEWVRRLARSLVSDADADDLAQDAWEASLRAEPEGRGWWATTLRNLAAFRHRSASRRIAREASASESEAAPSAEEVLERLEAQRNLTALVAELPEELRVVLYLRYFEGLDATRIGERLSLPPGTVRWKLKQGVDTLREQLDARFGNRQRWAALLLPFASADTSSLHLTTGALLMKLKHVVVLAIALVLGLLGAFFAFSDTPTSAPLPSGSVAAKTAPAGREVFAAADDVAQAAGPVPVWLAQAGAPARRVAGRVLLDGQPVAGAIVTLAMDEQPTNAPPQERVSGADGRFDFGAQRPVAIGVGASLPGKLAAFVEVDLRDPSVTPRPESLELTLASDCPGKLSGRVLDSGAGPVSGAVVRPRLSLGTKSDAQGAYELCLHRGTNKLVVEATGYGTIALAVQIEGSVRRDIVLMPEATVQGIVVDEANQPVADALITAMQRQFQNNDSARPGIARSNESGRFTMELAPGDYRMFAAAGGSALSTVQVVTAVVGQPSPEVKLVVREGVRIRGIVLSEGKPIAGAKVTAHHVAGGRTTDAFSQADGRFIIDGAPPGELVFTAEPWAVEKPKRWTAKAGAPEVTLEVKRMATVRGVVTRLKKPVAGAKVDANSMQAQLSVFADANGRYELVGVAKGHHQIIASSDTEGAFVAKDLAIKEREEVTLDLELEGAATIEGTVVDEKGAPIAGATVTWVNRKFDTGMGTSDEQGRYRATQMTGGDTYTVKVSLSGALGAPAKPVSGSLPSVLLKDGNSHEKNVKLQVKVEKLKLSGRVVDAQGAPVPDVKLRARAAGPQGEPSFSPWEVLPQAFSDANGQFTFDALTSGTWDVQARSPSGEETTVRAETGPKPLLITLRPTAQLDGKLVGYSKIPVVYAARNGGRFVAGQVNGDTFKFSLPAGTYVISAMDNEEGDAQEVTLAEGEKKQLTMHSKGKGKLTGRVIDHASGQPVANLVCHGVLAAGNTPGITNWDPASAPNTDVDGRFVVDPAPAGNLAFRCMGDEMQSGVSRLIEVAPGTTTDVTLEVVAKLPGVEAHTGVEMYGPTPVIEELTAGGAGQKSGLLVGDLVVSVDGQPVGTLDGGGVAMLLTNHAPGSTVPMVVSRQGKAMPITLVLSP